MKNLLLTTVIVGALLTGNETKAQLGFNFSINIGNRPAWGVPGNVRANYYYMPEIDCYYDLSARQFIYDDGGRWVFASNLPDCYRGYDLNRGYKVIVNEPRPYMRGDFYRQQYRGYYNNTYRRNNDYARRDMRPDFRNDNRRDERFDRGNIYEQRRDDRGRFDDRRNDDRRGGQMDNRNGQFNNGVNQQRFEDRVGDRLDNRGTQQPVINGNYGNNGNQQRDDRNDNRGANMNPNNGMNNNSGNDNRQYVPGQTRTAQRNGNWRP